MSAQRPDERTDAARTASDGFHNTLDGVVLARVEAGTVTLEAVNDGARALLGLTPDAPLPDPARGEEAWPVRAQPLARRLKLAAERGRATREQMVQRGSRGERIDLEVQLEPVPVGDGSVRVMAVLRAVPADESASSPGAGDGDTMVASVGVFRTERGLGAVFVDDALLELLGLSHEQALGQGWLDAIHADERGRVERALAAAVEREESVDVECRMLRDGVDERWARVRAVPMRGDDGRVTGCLGSIEDITDERISERAGARLTELAEAAHEIIGIVDTDWRIVYVNHAGRRRLGVPADDSFTTVRAMEFLPPELQATLGREISAELAREGQWTGAARLRALDGSLVDVECTILRHLAPTGEIDHYSFLGRDVTEMRRIERALLESEERFRLIAESSPAGIYLTRNSGALEYVNPRIADIFGRKPEEMIGLDVLRHVHPDDLAAFDAAGRDAYARRGEFRAEFRIVRPGGEVRWLRTQGAPVFDSVGAIQGYVGSVEDTTDQRLAQQELLRLQRTIETTTDLVTFHDTDGRMFYANAAARRFYGFGPDDPVPPIGPADFLGPAPDELLESVVAAFDAGTPWSGEVEIHGANGARLTTSLVLVAHEDARGEVEYVSALARDVSERRAAEQRLSTGVAWFRSIVQHAPDVLAVLNADARVTYVSPSVERLLGYSVDELMGARMDSPDAANSPLLAQVLAAPAAVVTKIGGVLRHKDTTVRWFEGSATNLLDDPVVQGIVINIRDVTDRREAESARRRSEAALRAIVQSSPLAIFALDRRGTVHVWNRECERMFGWTANDVVGGPTPFGHSDLRLDAALEQAFSGLTVTGCEGRVLRADETAVDVDLAIAPLRETGARVVTAVVVAADVTEQKRAARALQESEERFRSLVQHSSDLLTVVDADGNVLYMSPSAAAFNECDADAAVGSPPPIDNVLPEDVTIASEAFARLQGRAGATETFTMRVKRPDGLRWLELIAVNRLDDPAVGGIVTHSRDITDRINADVAIRASEERLQALVASVSDVIAVLDADGNLKYSSPVVEHLFGYPQGTGYGEEIFGLVHPDDRPRMVELFERAREVRGMFRPVEMRLARADGSWMHAEILANNLLDDPSVRGIVLTTRDITERKLSEEALRASERRLREGEAHYRAVVDDQTELVCRYLPDTTLTFANRAFADFYGHEPERLIGTRLVDLFPAADREATISRLTNFGPGTEVQTDEGWEYAADGSVHWYQWTDRAFADENGAVFEFQSVGRDISDQRRAAALTAHQAEILEQVARGEPLDETLSTIARTVEDHFPKLVCAISLLDDAGMTLRVGAAPSLPGSLRDALDNLRIGPANCSPGAAAYRRETVTVEDVSTDPLWADLRELAGHYGIKAAWSTPIFASDGNAVLGTLDAYLRRPDLPDDAQDQVVFLLAHLASIAIERKAFEERLAHQSMHDPLTGLPNRLLFLDRLTLAVARCRRMHSEVAVLFLDLDRFKNVNDSVGHDAGDELLVAVARRLESVLRPGDTVARFGGDEFTILCEDLTMASARDRSLEISHRLLAAVTQPFIVRGSETYMSASVGIALATGEERPEELLRDADAAMYHAKESGRGRVEVFDDTMRARALARHATENALHRALERGELLVFFQPVVSLAEARVIGAEALVRWQHPERGLVAPGEFVPLAEETGLVVELGTWVLEHAAREAALWHLESDQPFVVSVNLSARQLAQPDLAERLADIIERTGVKAKNLCLEITESVLMEDAEGVITVIERVRALGVRLAIDDFGTGYSSLGYLKRFPVDTVKIDRSFVSGLGTDPGDAAIVSAVIGLAHALDLQVVAEGVETEGQLAELLALGCDEAQGYFFAPPQPIEDLRGLMGKARNWRPPGAKLMTASNRPRPGRSTP